MGIDSSNLYQLKNAEQKVLEIELAEEYIKEVLVAISGLALNADVLNAIYAELDKIVIVNDNIDDVIIVADNIADVNICATNIQAIIDAYANAQAAEASELAAKASEQASALSETESELFKWESEAFRLTSDSYATEPEDIHVKEFSSDGDGTFSFVTTSEYSSYHWKMKAQQIANATLESLSDVDTTGKQDGSQLVYNSTTQMWEAGSGVAKTAQPVLSESHLNVVINATDTVEILDYSADLTYYSMTADANVATVVLNGNQVEITGGDLAADASTVISIRAQGAGMTLSDWTHITVDVLYVPIVSDGSIINTNFQANEEYSEGVTYA